MEWGEGDEEGLRRGGWRGGGEHDGGHHRMS